MLPAFAKPKHEKEEARTQTLIAYAETTSLNKVEDNGAKVGVITSGTVSYTHLDVYKRQCLNTHFQLSPNGSGTYRRPEPTSCQISPTIHSWPLLSTNSWVPFMDLASL